MMDAKLGGNTGQEINWNHVHDVPEQNPAEDSERKRTDVGARFTKKVFDGAVNKFKDNFSDVGSKGWWFVIFNVLQGTQRHSAHPPAEEATEQNGKEESVDMQRIETFANAQVGHMVIDDFRSSLSGHMFLYFFKIAQK